jgi:hypothetical protein
VEVYYPKGSSGRTEAEQDANALREVLVRTIADSHPGRPSDILANEYNCAKVFLSNYHRIFTLNYDLLLYWAVMQSEIEPNVRCDDGFRMPEDEPDADYVTWEPGNTYDQNIYYLHGALHLFDAGSELQKFTWANTGIALIDQIREALSQNKFPIFVSEGSSEEKYTHIRHNDYLAKSYRSFLQISGDLFVYGHGMAENDEHILHAIERNKVTRLFVSLHGDLSSTANKHIVRRASAMPGNRSGKHKLEIKYFQAETAPVWSSAPVH